MNRTIQAYVGDNITITVAIENTGENTAYDVVATLIVQEGLTLLDSDTKNLGNIGVGERVNATWTLHVDATGEYSLTVKITGLNIIEPVLGEVRISASAPPTGGGGTAFVADTTTMIGIGAIVVVVAVVVLVYKWRREKGEIVVVRTK